MKKRKNASQHITDLNNRLTVPYFIRIDVSNPSAVIPGLAVEHLTNVHVSGDSKSTPCGRKSRAIHHSSWSASQLQRSRESAQFPAKPHAHIWASGAEPAR